MSHQYDDPPKSNWTKKFLSASRVVVHHVRKHVGVGLVCSIAYFDPGNWGVDLQAGSTYGYRLLFVVLVAGLIAVILQVLATRLGCVTGLDLASHCRLLLHSHPKYPRLVRWIALYPLYILAEVAIISTDLAELLGSAMALCMLFPKLQLWQGVLITAGDVIFLLALKDPLRGRPVRAFELAMAFLVLAVLTCMCIIISRVHVEWNHAFQGYLPSKYIFPNGAFYTSVGILGATVMPHSLFLGSALATQDRDSPPESQYPSRSIDSSISSTSTVFSARGSPETSARKETPEGGLRTRGKSHTSISRIIQPFRLIVAQVFRTHPETTYGAKYNIRRHEDWENNSFDFVKRHLYHGIVDMTGSLLGFAVVINSMILILSSAVFFSGNGSGQTQLAAGLFDAYDLIRSAVGRSAATLFAIALLAAGQVSAIRLRSTIRILTICQAVAEGFLRWRVSPIIRRLFTRIIAIIPSMAVAIAFGRPGINALLVISQVILSIVLPFITLPLLYLTSSKKFMRVERPCSCCPTNSSPEMIPADLERVPSHPHEFSGNSDTPCHDLEEGYHSDPSIEISDKLSHPITPLSDLRWIGSNTTKSCEIVVNATANADTSAVVIETHRCRGTQIDYSNNMFITFLLCGVWIVIAAANVYAIVALAMGQSS
ncbi:natural resistance-associated macrophage protein-domain-containing protein [Lentinula lateritia]|uniref:Natural resistance-associated macrophage protein-domain-containing protein n=1 Tax=Lentinula lateritia TaxID=40482 RepID=A0ABQ8VYD2_9AGAR|nr:natural resistance-associated macrophage protein-domain-containing protein [Lentinula lateritia]